MNCQTCRAPQPHCTSSGCFHCMDIEDFEEKFKKYPPRCHQYLDLVRYLKKAWKRTFVYLENQPIIIYTMHNLVTVPEEDDKPQMYYWRVQIELLEHQVTDFNMDLFADLVEAWNESSDTCYLLDLQLTTERPDMIYLDIALVI